MAVLDSGARGSSTTFAENGQGDVLIAWENEAFFALQEYPSEYEIVVPSASVLCQPTVAKVDEVTQMNGTEGLADAYLSFLYTDDAQRLEAQNFYRPVNKDIQKEYEASSDSRNIKEIPSDGKWIVKKTLIWRISDILAAGKRLHRSFSLMVEYLIRYMIN